MNFNDDNRQALIRHRLDKAKHTMDDVAFLISNGKLFLAVNRIYYGAFYCLSALALKNGFLTSKHQQLIGWFNKTFIKENKIDKSHGEFIMRAYENRSIGDYDDFVEFNAEDVQLLFAGLKDFYNVIQEML